MCKKCALAGIGSVKKSKMKKKSKIGALRLDFKTGLMLAGGAVAGNYAAEKLVPIIPAVVPNIAVGGGLVLLGALLPDLVPMKGAEALMQGIGAGMAVAGGQILLAEAGIMGVDDSSASIGAQSYGQVPYGNNARTGVDFWS